MKKILLGLMILMLTISLSAQKTQYYDLIIQKTTPLLHLYGSGGIINWNNGDILWTHTSNTITMSGGNFLTSGTSYLGIGATSPLHQVVVASSLTNGLNAFNIVINSLTVILFLFIKYLLKEIRFLFNWIFFICNFLGNFYFA